MKFGEKLKALRYEKLLSQKAVADALGISRRAYITYECEGRYPRNRSMYKKLAEIFDVDINYLLTEDEDFVSEAAEKYGSSGKEEAEKLVQRLTGLFAGGTLSESDKDAVMIAMQKAYFDCKEENNKKAGD